MKLEMLGLRELLIFTDRSISMVQHGSVLLISISLYLNFSASMILIVGYLAFFGKSFFFTIRNTDAEAKEYYSSRFMTLGVGIMPTLLASLSITIFNVYFRLVAFIALLLSFFIVLQLIFTVIRITRFHIKYPGETGCCEFNKISNITAIVVICVSFIVPIKQNMLFPIPFLWEYQIEQSFNGTDQNPSDLAITEYIYIDNHLIIAFILDNQHRGILASESLGFNLFRSHNFFISGYDEVPVSTRIITKDIIGIKREYIVMYGYNDTSATMIEFVFSPNRDVYHHEISANSIFFFAHPIQVGTAPYPYEDIESFRFVGD